MTHWIEQVLIATDQWWTAFFGGFADETLSSYFHRLERDGKIAGKVMRPFVDCLARVLFGQQDHCLKAYQQERLRAQLPPEFR